MDAERNRSCTAFEGTKRLVGGSVVDVAAAVKRRLDSGASDPMLLFDDVTGEQFELDFQGTPEEVLGRLGPAADAPKGPGRPKLGVVAREVTLLPRHWEWLGEQPGGASVALRKLVDEARKAHVDKDRVRKGRDAAYRFLVAMGGNLAGFEEANRALFAGDPEKFAAETEAWPVDVRDYARTLARAAF
ncbi:DUF2239 family protein [Planctomyces sp. SH-PL62]|uniref:DUF2239 family protein n=1 Tax=Planctomyces sp. SH-PL62 TaxID=1636152 RepID=UPI00078B674F|nr:DUF2239 family protein [Planctomyces sp. SH-PL62]AMV36375.1 hypothetical protein VT85_02990 [Planctomyces sp. SH-PL62]